MSRTPVQQQAFNQGVLWMWNMMLVGAAFVWIVWMWQNPGENNLLRDMKEALTGTTNATTVAVEKGE